MINDHKRKYPNGRHRPVGPSAQYNCHGLTFGSRRTKIPSSQVEKILDEDDYKEICLEEVLPGDVVVYRKDGDIEHSGVVVAGFPEVWILGKWGQIHEVVHRIQECPYQEAYPSFYRIIK